MLPKGRFCYAWNTRRGLFRVFCGIDRDAAGERSTDSPATCSNAPILVVDDDEDVRSSLRVYLEMRGYTVVIASNGAEALDQLHGGLRPCIILLDLMMPKVDGFGFRRAQVGNPTLKDIPVVVFSGAYDATVQAMALGAAGHAEKPIDVARLTELIEHHRVR